MQHSLHTCRLPPPQSVDTTFTGCAKINPAKIQHSIAAIDLAKFLPGENFPLYGIMHNSSKHSM